MVTLIRPEIAPLGEQTVVVLGVQQFDEFGDPIGPPGGETKEIPGCAVWPKGADEASFRASTTTDELVWLAPILETDVKASASVEWRGRKYTVEGNPMPWIFSDGDVAGVQINLKKTGG